MSPSRLAEIASRGICLPAAYGGLPKLRPPPGSRVGVKRLIVLRSIKNQDIASMLPIGTKTDEKDK